MRKSKAKIKAEDMKKIIDQECYVIKVRIPFEIHRPSTWFSSFENVSSDYLKNHKWEGKIYYKTK